MANIYDKLDQKGVRIGTLGKSLRKIAPPKIPKAPNMEIPKAPKPPAPMKIASEIYLQGMVAGYIKQASAAGWAVDEESARLIVADHYIKLARGEKL